MPVMIKDQQCSLFISLYLKVYLNYYEMLTENHLDYRVLEGEEF